MENFVVLKRTDSADPDFVMLVNKLDNYLAVIDGEEHAFYDTFNKIVNLAQVVLAYVGQQPVGCGAIKELSAGIMEVKRMFTDPAFRQKGVAALVLSELEKWSMELGASTCMLETGKRMSDAVSFYARNGYRVIPNYGQYAGIENSICFSKSLATD